ncbi:uncharacterized protein LOC131010427 [Salvia miltiorrhiza]|uniref:uncharacterized protein LOC131010427 n=1 Tax=Salvia miltiorrhiza TaxID=226208 RepID=UPI0025ABC40C|nr:uncharacterized protein LOC131010427 [Salvia miltiorrhiza]
MKSEWWAKVIEEGGRGTDAWFRENISRRLGNGRETNFWDHPWAGPELLKHKFPRFFRLSLRRDVKVEECGRWEEGSWKWELKWRRTLRETEMEAVNLLTSFISPFVLIADSDDGWSWSASTDGKFTTKLAYEAIKTRRSEITAQSTEALAAASVWQTLAPQKAVVNAWIILRRRLPTCDELRKWNINLGDGEVVCKQCFSHNESINHVFTLCSRTQEVWNEIQLWIGIQIARPSTSVEHWRSFCYFCKNKTIGKLLKAIWVGCCWLLWQKRNGKRFEGKDWEGKDVVLELKARIWSWNRCFGILNNEMEFSSWSSNDLISRIL